MQEIKSPLWIFTSVYALSFLDGMFGWGFDDGAYLVLGLAQLAAIIWMWVIVKANK
jgi:hypothetical protein